MCELDLINCYWSIALPKSWHKVFVVSAGPRHYKYTRLPFESHYSPSIGQTLIRKIVQLALHLAGVRVKLRAFLDDILLDSRQKRTSEKEAICLADGSEGGVAHHGEK